MIDREPDWTLLRSFLLVLEQGGLSGAARVSGQSQPTLGRHVDALEAALGVNLFTRSPAGLAPTEHALLLAPHARAMASAAATFSRAASGGLAEERGVVRVSASEIIGCEVLPQILASLRREYPLIDVELALSNQNADLLRRDADMAVRMVRPTQAALLARHIGASPVGLFAHQSYLDALGAPQKLEDLKRHRLIGYDRDDRIWRLAGPPGANLSRQSFGLRCDSDMAQLAALRAGAGIGVCQNLLTGKTPGLCAVLPEAMQFPLEIYLVMHEDLKATRRLRLVYAHLAEGLQAFVAGRLFGRAAA